MVTVEPGSAVPVTVSPASLISAVGGSGGVVSVGGGGVTGGGWLLPLLLPPPAPISRPSAATPAAAAPNWDMLVSAATASGPTATAVPGSATKDHWPVAGSVCSHQSAPSSS